MSSASPARFRFDLDLGNRAERSSVITETGLAALVAEAREQGRVEGLAEGERTAAARAAQAIAKAAQALADHSAAMNAALDDDRRTTRDQAIALAASIGRKLAHQLIAREPAAEIEALITECLASLDAVPHLVVRCHPDLADEIREIAQSRVATSGFAGRLIVLGDPDRALSDARIEWVDGGLVRDTATLEAEIDARISQFIDTRHEADDDTGEPAA